MAKKVVKKTVAKKPVVAAKAPAKKVAPKKQEAPAKKVAAKPVVKQAAKPAPKVAAKPAAKKAPEKITKTTLTKIVAGEHKMSSEDIKNYIKEVELQKQNQRMLNSKMVEEDAKIGILNQNISKLDQINSGLEQEAMKVRKSSTDLATEIAELKLQLEKAQAESKLTWVKQIKSDISINAKIIKEQETNIQRLREQREIIRREQEAQKERLLEKRAQIEQLKNEAVAAEFADVDGELMDLINSALANSTDKTQIMAAALEEVNAEMDKVRMLEAQKNAENQDNITLLKTQMFNLRNIDPNAPAEQQIQHAHASTSTGVTNVAVKDFQYQTAETPVASRPVAQHQQPVKHSGNHKYAWMWAFIAAGTLLVAAVIILILHFVVDLF